ALVVDVRLGLCPGGLGLGRGLGLGLGYEVWGGRGRALVLNEEEKKRFWKVLDEVRESLSKGYDDMHEGFGFGDRNDEGAALLDFVRAFGLVIVNLSFSKKKDHLITFQNKIAKIQIDFLLLRKEARALCKDGKVILGKNLSTKNRLLVMELVIKKGKKRRDEKGRPRIKWDSLTQISALEIGEKGRSGQYWGDWWWTGEVKKKVEIKKATYAKLVESKDEEEQRVNRKKYKLSRTLSWLRVRMKRSS
ncbi:uncharacterized protein LOC124894972, partial [Capsicum annuum]|uniref:uncharacterized protein LOC124894972 n=1 Tax=Capsicum annuum TaxID=4072 RepID=UPI001FB1776B